MPDAVSGANAATDAVDIPLAISTAMNVVAAAATLAAIESVPSVDDANYACADNSDGNNTVCMSDETILTALQSQ